MRITATVNGRQRTDDVQPRMLLVDYLRDVCGLRAAHTGCETTSCGACTVLMDGQSVKSCTVLAVQVDGADVTTLEGLSSKGGVQGAGGLQGAGGADDAAPLAGATGNAVDLGMLHPVAQAFHEEHALQCGFCTPGMVMAAVGLLRQNPHPSPREVRRGLQGNLCRCTGYQNIVRAVQRAAEHLDPA